MAYTLNPSPQDSFLENHNDNMERYHRLSECRLRQDIKPCQFHQAEANEHTKSNMLRQSIQFHIQPILNRPLHVALKSHENESYNSPVPHIELLTFLCYSD